MNVRMVSYFFLHVMLNLFQQLIIIITRKLPKSP